MIACALTLTALALGALRSTEAQGLRSGLLAGDVSQRSVGRVPFSTRSLSQMFDSGDDNGDDEADDDAGGDDDVAPAPASIGTDVPLSYFGPSPSQVDRRLIGPFQLLKSGTVNETAGTVTIPIYKGFVEEPGSERKGSDSDGEVMFYIVTDTTDKGNAEALGLNHSPKLRYGNVGRGARKAYLDTDTIVHFEGGKVDFSPERSLTPGDDAPFPPKAVQPGSVGDEYYTPLFVLENAGGEVYNGPVVSMGASIKQLQQYCDGIPADKEAEARKVVHDSVVAICPDDSGIGGTVTLKLVPGFSFARPVLYLSLDASNDVAATLEEATLAPGLTDIKIGGDDTIYSAVERIFITINGHTNEDVNPEGLEGGPGESVHPSRQGLNSAIMGEGAALNVLGGIPTIGTDYSPLWDGNLGMWTDYAVANGYRVRTLEEFQILGFVQRGFMTGVGGAPYGSSGFIVNCPIVFRFL